MQDYLRTVGIPGLGNFGIVASGIYRSQRPEDPLGYRSAKEIPPGVASIIDLEPLPDPPAVIAELGIAVIHAPMSTSDHPSIAENEEFLRLVKSAPKAVLIHCRYGRERTGFRCALLRIDAGWSLEDAVEEMLQYGFREVLAFPLMKSLTEFAKSRGAPSMSALTKNRART
jgi:tyrosine-protein phosphatase SIW14